MKKLIPKSCRPNSSSSARISRKVDNTNTRMMCGWFCVGDCLVVIRPTSLCCPRVCFNLFALQSSFPVWSWIHYRAIYVSCVIVFPRPFPYLPKNPRSISLFFNRFSFSFFSTSISFMCIILLLSWSLRIPYKIPIQQDVNIFSRVAEFWKR